MKKCELCECPARMYCESDRASLCWDCDEKVHCANFLVAKHSRCLLCHVCQSLTPWKASGPKLCSTVSVCDACAINATRCGVNDDDKTVQRENQSDSTGGHDETDDEDDYDDDAVEDEDLDEEEEEEGEEDENQVVPLSGDSQSSSPPPPPAVSSSSCSSISDDDISSKRMRDFADLFSDDEIGCSSQPGFRRVVTNEEAATTTTTATSLSSFRPLKQRRAAISDQDHSQPDSRSTAIINSLQGLQNQMITNNVDASATIIGICRLSRDQTR